MARKKFSFKSSGKLVTARELTENLITVNPPIGIKTPLEFSSGRNGEDLYKMHFDAADQIKDNFRNLLLTNFGERLGNAGLGANLKALLYDASSLESIESEVIRRITITANKYLPIIEINNIEIRTLGLDTNSKNTKTTNVYNDYQHAGNSSGLFGIVVFVKYSIPRLQSANQAIEVTLTVAA
tara:strand:- start:1003 stop:1551 length:549 start_codon:yes stop_codon:yes gene_type:complete